MELYYCHPSGITPPTIILDDFESRHLITTMRKKNGERIIVTDGLGGRYQCTITNAKKQVLLHIDQAEKMEPPQERIGLAIGYIRPNRLEFIFEKGTELGVTDFYLMRSRYSNYKAGNPRRYEKYLRQAIKQSLHYFLPQLHILKDLNEVILHTPDYGLRIAAIDPEAPALKETLNTCPASAKDKLLVVGPEGGFSADEIEQMDKAGFKKVSLGNYRLRAETAALAGITLLNMG